MRAWAQAFFSRGKVPALEQREPVIARGLALIVVPDPR